MVGGMEVDYDLIDAKNYLSELDPEVVVAFRELKRAYKKTRRRKRERSYQRIFNQEAEVQEKTLAFPQAGYMRIDHVLQFIPIGKSTWWQWVKEGKAPKPVKLGPRTTAWKVEEIRELIERLGNGATD